MISVVIPVYNEEKNLRRLMERLQPVLDGLPQPLSLIHI